jgi:hypothetical protein
LRRRRVPGTKAPRSFTVPRCSKCGKQTQKNAEGEWFCPVCADEWLKTFVESKTRGRSVGGVELPYGIEDDRRAKAPSFRDIYPNRRARRLAKVK